MPDNRDNRGKKHELAFVILLFMYSILRSQDTLNYSKLHRKMKKEFKYLRKKINIESSRCVSYSQLKRILFNLDYEVFNEINNEFFSKKIEKQDRQWKAIDGKELRGTIDKIAGQKRSENLVQQVDHQNKESEIIGFYNGSKESEKTTVKNYFHQQESLENKAFSLDALHTDAKLMKLINRKEGTFLMQIKENQKHLLEDCKQIYQNFKAKDQYSTIEKGHGRLEERKGFLHLLNVECLDKKWQDANIQTLVVIERERTILKTGQQSKETVYFTSNLKLNKTIGKELFTACRNHWGIESDNYVRDVNFGEDKIHSLLENIPRVMATALGTVLNLLRRKNKNNNLRELREDLAQNRTLTNRCFCG